MISTPSMSILLNGTPTNTFKPSRGLRQGDPLSPFLFNLAMDGLGKLINARVSRGEFKGLRLWGDDLTITHQQFVDDVMMYSQANLEEAKKLGEILTKFTKASGTEVNKEKTEIFFFNTPRVSQAFLARTMGLKIGQFPTKYLRVQLSDQHNKIVNWKGLLRKIKKKRMDNWTLRKLNTPSCLILLKSILQAMPVYQMASQAIPKTICQKMLQIFKNFMWQGSNK